MKELLTASRMGKLQTCPFAHYLRYELGLRSSATSDALRFGSAWHRAMEARAKGADIEAALAAAIGDRSEVDELQVATLSGLLAGYWRVYGTDAWVVRPEVEFEYCIGRGRAACWAAGKIDGIREMPTCAVIEYKTAGCDIGPDSEYWLRLRGNVQIMAYVEAARKLGYDPRAVIYDVARKPSIAPRDNVPTLDASGLKIVLGPDWTRAMKRDGTPKQTADREKGEFVHCAPETPEQFGDRLAADTFSRPEFYFARREVPILDAELDRFRAERADIVSEIRWRRRRCAWPRNVSERMCQICEFAGFCLQGVVPDAEHVPAGFVIGEKNPELTNEHA